MDKLAFVNPDGDIVAQSLVIAAKKRLVSAKATTSLVSVGTVPAGKKWLIENILVTSDAAATVRLHFLESGESALLKNAVLYDTSIAANDAVSIPAGQIISASGGVSLSASVNNAIGVQIWGVEL